MNKKHYLKLVREAQDKKIKITKQMEKDIREAYRKVAKDLEKELAKVNPNTVTEKWLYEYKKELEREIDKLTKSIYKTTKQKLEEVAEASNSPQLSLFDDIDSKHSLGMKDTFSDLFARANRKAIDELLSGKIYKDGLGLSERLWIDSKYMKKDIQKVIIEGIASKKSSYDLAKDLQKYVNPDAKKAWDWSKVYPGTKKKIEYNSQRLARTAIQHTYQMSQKRSCEDNPFIEGIEWKSVFAHGRTCELCKERDGNIYSAKDTPLDHPNGLCYQVPSIPKSFDEIGEELRRWVDGEDNPGIDNWVNKNY